MKTTVTTADTEWTTAGETELRPAPAHAIAMREVIMAVCDSLRTERRRPRKRREHAPCRPRRSGNLIRWWDFSDRPGIRVVRNARETPPHLAR